MSQWEARRFTMRREACPDKDFYMLVSVYLWCLIREVLQDRVPGWKPTHVLVEREFCGFSVCLLMFRTMHHQSQERKGGRPVICLWGQTPDYMTLCPSLQHFPRQGLFPHTVGRVWGLCPQPCSKVPALRGRGLWLRQGKESWCQLRPSMQGRGLSGLRRSKDRTALHLSCASTLLSGTDQRTRGPFLWMWSQET